MHLKVFVKLKKNPKNPLVWAKKTKKPKTPKKNPKKPTGLGFFQPCLKDGSKKTLDSGTGLKHRDNKGKETTWVYYGASV
jgi:hypothetical protein